MKFIEVAIYTVSEAVEIVTAVLMELGVGGLVIEDGEDIKNLMQNGKDWDYIDDELVNSVEDGAKVKFYVPDDLSGHETVISVKNTLETLKSAELEVPTGDLSVEVLSVDDEDWLNNWKKYYKPFEIGEKIVVKPEWEEYPNTDGKVIFNINPGLAFGTGMHQTTQLCIMQLEKYIKDRVSVIDIGCGSGILSVISLLLGAERVFAADIDTNAIRATEENLKLNNIPQMAFPSNRSSSQLASGYCEVVLGNILSDDGIKLAAGTGYDIVLANIVADAIIGVCGIVPGILKQGGVFIASGIIKERLDDVYAAISENNLELIDTFEKDDWICVVCRNFS